MRALPQVSWLLLVAQPLAAQPSSGTSEHLATSRFVAEARAGSARYRSQGAAIEDGFRRVGLDFPSMGEHWVNPGRALSGDFAPGRPAMLTYVRVGGEPVLVGVGYIALLGPGAEPPRVPPANGYWHEHNGSVVEESRPLHHPGGASGSSSEGAADGIRVSVLHAWVWAENPSGLFVAENHALPFVRLGIAAHPDLPPAARHALSLALDDEGYHASVIRGAVGAAPAEADAIDAMVTRYRSLARQVLDDRSDPQRLDATSVSRLEAVWSGMWEALEHALPSRTRPLQALRAHF
jgi:hypothetical protein